LKSAAYCSIKLNYCNDSLFAGITLKPYKSSPFWCHAVMCLQFTKSAPLPADCLQK